MGEVGVRSDAAVADDPLLPVVRSTDGVAEMASTQLSGGGLFGTLSSVVPWVVMALGATVASGLAAAGRAAVGALLNSAGYSNSVVAAVDAGSFSTWGLSAPLVGAVLWCLGELAFYFHYRRKRRELEEHPRPRGLSPADRREMFSRCVAVVDNAEVFLTGWFRGAPLASIARGNVQQWLAWAFFHLRWMELSSSERAELDEQISRIEKLLGRPLPPGYNKAVRSIRLQFDPMQTQHKPLGYYVVLSGLHAAFTVTLRWEGYQCHSVGEHTYWYHANDLGSYDRKPTTAARRRTAIVFLHGIGIGLMPYGYFVRNLLRLGCPTFLVELPHISSRLGSNVPSVETTVADLAAMLRRHDFTDAVFVGHSMGTVYSSWMIRKRPDLVRSVVLIDPVVFMLCESHVAYNFLYRSPSNFAQWLMSIFAARELHIAHTLTRTFDWTQNILWADMLRMPSTVVLSETDSIVNSVIVRRYLEQSQHVSTAPVRVVHFPATGHAGFLTSKEKCREILAEVARYVDAPTTPVAVPCPTES